MELVRHKMLYGRDDLRVYLATLSINGMTTARKPQIIHERFLGFTLKTETW